jgi:ATP-dependent DNA ligase
MPIRQAAARRADRPYGSAPAVQRSCLALEPKYDGFRGMLYLTRHACTLYSKRGNRMYRFQELAEQVRAEVPRRELILDGEIVAIDDEGRINFWDLMRGGGTLAYAAFDVLWLNGRDLQSLPLAKRKQRLQRMFPLVLVRRVGSPASRLRAASSSRQLASWIRRV